MTLLVTLVQIASLLVLAPRTASAADSVNVVAVGDSYTAGTNGDDYYGPQDCYQSLNSYPEEFTQRLVAKGVGATLNTYACHGAETDYGDHNIEEQLEQARASMTTAEQNSVDLVLMTAGGNDGKFSGIVRECFIPVIRDEGTCREYLQFAQDNLNVITDRVQVRMMEAHTFFPNAIVVLVGYPYLVAEGFSDQASWDFSPPSWTRELGHTADSLYRDMVVGLNSQVPGTYRYIGLTDLFSEHEVGSNDPWITTINLGNPLNESYHPNQIGYKKISNLLYDLRIHEWPDNTTQYTGDIVKWDGDSVTSWYVGSDGYRHWIENVGVDTYGCLVGNGSDVHMLNSQFLDRIPDAWGDHATCTPGSGGSSGDGSGDSNGISGFFLPYPEGVSHVVTQAPGSQFSHTCPGNSCRAIDFDMSLNDPVVASATGTIYHFETNHSDFGKMVILKHNNGRCSLYGHMNGLSSSITNGGEGASILQGQTIGFAGETGYTFGVHLHFALVDCSTWQSVNVDFNEVADPAVSTTYVSQNTIPDTDGDGVNDLDDDCIEEAGTVENNGCPEDNLRLGSEDSAITDSRGRVFDFRVADNGKLYLRSRNLDNHWAWTSHGNAGTILDGEVSVTMDDRGRIEAFVIGEDGNLYRRQRNLSNTWKWFDQGNPGIQLLGSPSVTIDARGRILVFARGADNQLWDLTRNLDNNWNWHAHATPGVDFDGDPLAFLDSRGRVNALVVGSDGNLYRRERNLDYNWGWANHGNVGLALKEGLAATIDDRGRVLVFAIGSDGQVYRLTRNLDYHWGWSSHDGAGGDDFVGAASDASPTVVLDDRGRVTLLVAGTDGDMWSLIRNLDYDWNWNNHGNNGSNVAGDVSVTLDSRSWVESFAVDTTGELQQLQRNLDYSWNWFNQGTQGGEF